MEMRYVKRESVTYPTGCKYIQLLIDLVVTVNF